MAIFTQNKLSSLLGSQHHFHTPPHVPISRPGRQPHSAAFKTQSNNRPAIISSSYGPGFNDPSLISTWSHRAWVATGCAAVLATLARTAAGAASSGHWVEPALAALAGYLAADLASGAYHWAVDNYGDASTPVFGPQVEAFRGHHERPRTIARRQFANNTHAAARAVALALVPVLLLLNRAGPAALAFAGVCGACVLLSQQFHAWAHAAPGELPPLVAGLQGLGLLVSPRQHAAHHRPPHAANYCIVSGVWNAFLDDAMVFRAIGMVLFFSLGVRPRSWGDAGPVDHQL